MYLSSIHGCVCHLHTDSCKNCVVFERHGHKVSMKLQLRVVFNDELACYAIASDGTDVYHVAFTANEHIADEKGLKLNGVIMLLVSIYSHQ